jgi:uncharacterized protein (DUF433 family)
MFRIIETLFEGEAMQSDAQLLNRISVDSETMAGKPVIKGTRLTVEFILNLLAHGASYEEILCEYPGLTQEDLSACLLFAGKSLAKVSFMPLLARVA